MNEKQTPTQAGLELDGLLASLEPARPNQASQAIQAGPFLSESEIETLKTAAIAAINSQPVASLPAVASPVAPAVANSLATTTDHKFEVLLTALGKGNHLIDAAKLAGFESIAVVERLISTDSVCAERYQAAQRVLADVLAAQCIAIADAVEHGEDLPKAKLQCEERRKYAASLNPTKYGSAREQAVATAQQIQVIPVINVYTASNPRPISTGE